MYLLHGKVRKLSSIKTKEGKTLRKIFVEHFVNRGPGQDSDLRLEELICDPETCQGLEEGREAYFDVRPYPKGREIGLSVSAGADKIAGILAYTKT